MSFPPYPEYKDSGVEWLGDVPTHWATSRLKWHLLANDGGVWGSDPDGSDDTIVLRSTEQTVDGRWQIEDPAYRKLTVAEKSTAQLLEGDLLLTKSSGSSLHIGKTTLVDKVVSNLWCCYSNFMQRLRPAHSLSPKICWYILNNFLAREQFGILSNSTTGLANLNGSIIGEVLIPVAPLMEQSAIAAFLDRETAKIDALVAEQKKLIELLKEKRQAVISHAVTKGLDPNVPMKDSGVEWLEEVPEHWGLVPLKWFSRCASGENTSSILVEPEDNGELFPIIGGNGVMGYGPSSNINKTVIIIGRVGALCGNIHLIKEKAWITDNALILDASSTMFDHEFLTFLLKARNLNEIASKTAQPLITGTQVRDQRIPTPPIDEQVKIVDYLKHQLSTFDSLIQESQRAIDLLKERRAALISAAVTGKIDVRGLTEAML